MKVSAALPTGVAALFSSSARRRRELEERLVRRLEAGGFEEVILPVVDYLDPYRELLGPSDQEGLYRFVDRDGEMLALRVDFTPMLARLIAPRLASLELPLQLFYRGDVLRYQEERAGRERELYQLGAEVLGAGEEGDERVLRNFLELLAAGERRRLLVVMSFAGALDELFRRYAPDDPGALAAAVRRRERWRARAVGAEVLEVVEGGVPHDPGCLGAEVAARLERLTALRAELARELPAVELRIDLAEFADQSLGQGLGAGSSGYYDGLVFRAFAGREADPVGSGGRYDRLFHHLGAQVTAAGFSLSVDHLLARQGEEEAG